MAVYEVSAFAESSSRVEGSCKRTLMNFGLLRIWISGTCIIAIILRGIPSLDHVFHVVFSRQVVTFNILEEILEIKNFMKICMK